jgi:hypothetical protein
MTSWPVIPLQRVAVHLVNSASTLQCRSVARHSARVSSYSVWLIGEQMPCSIDSWLLLVIMTAAGQGVTEHVALAPRWMIKRPSQLDDIFSNDTPTLVRFA